MMMMTIVGEGHRANPIVQVCPWDLQDDSTASIHSPFSVSSNGSVMSPNGDTTANHSHLEAFAALQRYLPSNVNDVVQESDDCNVPADAFSCDQFRMFEFKVRRCARGRSHDWTECPYAHPGEKARRRDPRKYHYSGTACPDFRKGLCTKGDACEFAHGVFECWLHPARYRTQPCKDGIQCRRRVCFFAHTPDQLRVMPQTSTGNHVDSYDGWPSGLGLDSYGGSPIRLGPDSLLDKGPFGSSPTYNMFSPPASPPSESPPMSPSRSLHVNSVGELTASIRNLQIGKFRTSMSPPSWGAQMGSALCSPRSPSFHQPGFMSLPSTPTRTQTRSGLGVFDLWDKCCDEEPVMERVESGKDLRAKIYAKLSKENSLQRP